MQFLFHGRVGRYLVHEEFESLNSRTGIEEARRRLEGYQGRPGAHGRVQVDLTPILPPIWEANNWGGQKIKEEIVEYMASEVFRH